MERDQLEVDVLFVGAGPASLSGALHLMNLVRRHNEAVQSGKQDSSVLEEPTILVVEKGKEIGAHGLSGAVVDPRGFDELLNGLDCGEPPYDSPVEEDSVLLLTKNNSFRFPVNPPPLQNHGYYVASLGKLVAWMSEVCESQGVEVYPGFAGSELLFEGERVQGVRMGDKGRDRQGTPKSNFEPGIDVLARVTVLGEGPRGTLTGQAEARLNLREGRQPQNFAIGVKEIWEVPGEVSPGVVYHTLGFPLGTEELGGGFIYTMQGNLIDVGYVAGLDARNPFQDGHHLLQQFKTHPFVRRLLEGGKPISYGAKAIPEGGYYAMPKLYADGLLIIGDSAGFLNSQRLKGIHLGIKSGMLAAETIFEALQKEDVSSQVLKRYESRFQSSWARQELWKVRNFRQPFHHGFWNGMFHAGIQFFTGGRGLRDPYPTQPGHTRMQQLGQYFGKSRVQPQKIEFDGKLTFDKLSDIYLSDTVHEEDQPCHLKVLDLDVCNNRCMEEYGNPCQHFCPANVYEIVDEAEDNNRLRVNFSNCIHCKTCEIADPYQIILWTPPEGEGGPNWKNM